MWWGYLAIYKQAAGQGSGSDLQGYDEQGPPPLKVASVIFHIVSSWAYIDQAWPLILRSVDAFIVS